MNPEFLDVDDLKRMPWRAAIVASPGTRWRNASRGIPARSNYKFSWKRDEPPGSFVNAPHSLFEPILESQPRHFLEIATIGREQKGVAGQRDRRNFQITRGNRILTWLVSSRITGIPRPTRLDDRPHGRLRFQRA